MHQKPVECIPIAHLTIDKQEATNRSEASGFDQDGSTTRTANTQLPALEYTRKHFFGRARCLDSSADLAIAEQTDIKPSPDGDETLSLPSVNPHNQSVKASLLSIKKGSAKKSCWKRPRRTVINLEHHCQASHAATESKLSHNHRFTRQFSVLIDATRTAWSGSRGRTTKHPRK